MASLLTNTSAMTALQTLQSTNKNLATTQNRIATGERVSSASDNAAYWSIATGMKAQNASLSAVKDTLGLGVAVADVAYTGLSEAIKITEQIQAKYVAQEQFETGTDGFTALDTEITALKAQVAEIAKAATFQGTNLLATAGTTAGLSVVASFSANAAAGEATTTIDLDHYDLEGALATATDAQAVETALNLMKTEAANLGSNKTRLENQSNFTGQLMDAIDRGVGQLVDADMNAESARLSALQTQQQLGIQALSIANQNSQSILSLFR
jgi:flagellin